MVKFLSSQGYEDKDKNHGDCVILVDGRTAVIYDCGSIDHANRAIEILDENGIDKAIVILSHNDDDHFQGIPTLIEEGRVEKLFTILLLKYKGKILDKIDDGRRNKDSIGRAIIDMYDNIASLSEKVTLRDVYENIAELPSQIKFVGPEFDYMIEAVAKGLDGREGDTIDKERVVNAASVQVRWSAKSQKILLTGDCAPAAIPASEDLDTYDYIQLPHHGKPALAKEIFHRTENNINITFVVSDNTGNSNGGSDKLETKGHRVKNTKNGDVDLSAQKTVSPYSGRSLGL